MRDPAYAPIEFSETLVEAIADAFDVDGVVSASLIGSHATGKATHMSDLDLAVWLDPALSPRERWDLHLRLFGDATRLARSEAVDVVVLNDAPPLLQHRAIRDGRRILVRDAVQRMRSDTQAVIDYLDTQPLRDELAASLRRSFAEDGFGRR